MTEEPGTTPDEIEARISAWRGYLLRRKAVHRADVDELEDHLRGQIGTLTGAGLNADEAFLVAVKRIGELDALTREFAREHSERLWKQLVGTEGPRGAQARASRKEAFVAIGLAVLAALSIKVPVLFGFAWDDGSEAFYARNLSLFGLPFVAAYFAWKRRLDRKLSVMLGAAFVAAALVINLIPFVEGGSTAVLAVIHLPIALWLAVGVAYAGGRWRDPRERMNFVRFSGELFIYFVLIALGGGVTIGITLMVFAAIGLQIEWIAQQWLLPCGALGALVIGSFLVEAKQSVIENMAPVLTRIFTPLFTLVLLVFLGAMAWTGAGIAAEREVLIAFDLLLALVLGLLLYAVSARDPEAPPGFFDGLLLVLVASALLVDAIALTAISARISDFGFSANKTAALGENLILLANLSWSAWLLFRFLRGRAPISALERWQTAYLPVYSGWALAVVVVLPPLFHHA